MAKINNIELKKITNFKGHEGEPLVQGDIYYKGKKVGFYSQDAWGGEDRIDIDHELSQELKEEICNILSNYHSNTIFKDENEETSKYDFKGGEFLFYELMILNDYESSYKKFCKKWNVSCIAFIRVNWCNNAIMGATSKYELERKISANSEYDHKDYHIFKSLEDFNIITNVEVK